MEYINLIVFAAIVILIGVVAVVILPKLGQRRPVKEKIDTYECGVPLLATSRDRFPVHFYPVAIMFILFDIETVFLIPWAVAFKPLSSSIGVVILIEMLVFIAILGWGLLYIVKEGLLDWDK